MTTLVGISAASVVLTACSGGQTTDNETALPWAQTERMMSEQGNSNREVQTERELYLQEEFPADSRMMETDGSEAAPPADRTASDAVYKNDLGEIILGDYTHIEVYSAKQSVSEEMVDEELNELVAMTGGVETVFLQKGYVEADDTIRLRYEGSIAGELIEGLSSEDEEFSLGEGIYPESFEKALIGLEVGRETTFDVVLPADDEELPGESVHFTVTILGRAGAVGEGVTVSDSWTVQNTEYASADELRRAVRQQLERELLREELDEVEKEILTQLAAVSEITLSADAVKTDKQSRIDETCREAEREELSYEDYLYTVMHTDRDSYETGLEFTVKEELSCRLAAEALIEKEQIDVSDEAFMAYLAFEMTFYGYEDVQTYYKDIQLLGYEDELRQEFKNRQAVLRIREI